MTPAARPLLVLSLAASLGACSRSAEPLGVVGLDVPADSRVIAASAPRGIYFVTDNEEPVARFGPGPKHRIIYMNRNGGTYTKGNDNSVNNTSIVPDAPSQLDAWSYGDAKWTELMACVKLQYARFDVEITDVEPASNVVYIESAVGGTPQQLGLPANVGGVAPVAGNCSVVERGIAFTFSGVYNGRVQQICETVAQETSHAFGMDHEFLCQDPMTYLGGCGAKTFQDVDTPCGEDEARQCMCGDDTQNSVKVLLEVLGPSDSVAPTVAITEPADGAEVEAGFTINADADDNKAVTKVDFFLDGDLLGSDATAPYTFEAPPDLGAGDHTVEARAYDAAGSVSAANVEVTIATPGGSDPGTGGSDPGTGGSDPGTGGSDPGTGGSDPGTGGSDPGAGGSDPDDNTGNPSQDLVGGCSVAAGGRDGAGGPMGALLVVGALGLALHRRRRS